MNKSILSFCLAFALLLGLLPAAPTAAAAGDVTINASNFPDANFRSYVSESFDQNGDGVLSPAEIANVTYVHCSESEITSLKGIEFFTALIRLYCDGNQLTALDVSKNAALDELYCSGNQLTALDLSKNTALEVLYCDGNQLTTLDVSKNTALQTLYCNGNTLTELDLSENTAMTFLSCGGSHLTSLDVSNNAALTELYCFANALTMLDVSNNAALMRLNCDANQLMTLDVSRCTALTDLSCESNKLTILDVNGCTALTSLSCDSNQLTTLDVSKNTALNWLDCGNNQLTNLDVSGCAALTGLYCVCNQIPTLDISENPILEDTLLTGEQDDSNTGYHSFSKRRENGLAYLLFDYKTALLLSDGSSYYENADSPADGIPIDEAHFPDEGFLEYVRGFDLDEDGFLSDSERTDVTHIDILPESGITSLEGIEFFPALTGLYCGGSHLTALDLSKNTALSYLNCESSQLTELDVSGCTSLAYVNCTNNQLTTLDISKNTELLFLYSQNNQLTELDLSKNTALKELYCDGNQLTALDVSKNAALFRLTCGNNQLTTLDISKNTVLASISCGNNRLTTLDVSECEALTSLSCVSNQLTALDVSGCAALKRLYCYSNQLKVLDVSKNVALTDLDCDTNQLTALDVSKNTGLTFLSCYSNQLTELDVSLCTELEELYCHANQIQELDISANSKLSDAVLNGSTETSFTDFNYFYLGRAAISFDRLTTVRLPNGQTYMTPISEFFTDVKESAYYASAVFWAVQKGITAGTGDGSFSPNQSCTREQVVTFLWKAAGSPEPEATTSPFPDVKPGKYYFKPVLWAVEQGITSGLSDGRFGVGRACTREQVVSFLWKAVGSPEPEGTENPFTDVKPGKYYYKPVLWAVENGVTSGISATSFGVGKTCTRAQIVTFLYNVYGK